MKLVLENFQAHEKSELNLKPFTVIVGHSNAGKTAIIRALKSVLFNDFKKSYVKLNKKESSISLSLDGSDITVRRSKSIEYDIDGKTYGAVGRGELEYLINKGYFSIDIDKKKHYPQLDRQFDSP